MSDGRQPADRSLVDDSRFLSLVLRHAPQRIGLQLDRAGWADMEALLQASAAHGRVLTRARIAEVVEHNDKCRFALDAGGERIRASQGHSIDVDLGLQPVEPPARLFHGTATRFLRSIDREGLKPGRRRHVHLSDAFDTARQVGLRHGMPIVLGVQAAAMHVEGHAFYRADNGVWLVDRVPARFIVRITPEAPARGEREASHDAHRPHL